MKIQTKYASASDERLPLYQRLRDSMSARIAAGEWKPDQAIPPEHELAKEFQVAVGTLRKAVDLLVEAGLLDRRQGKGTFVRRAAFDSSLFRFFRHQDGASARTIPESRVLNREIVPAPPHVAAMLNLAPDAVSIRLSRLRLLAGQPILIEDIWLSAERFPQLTSLPLDQFGDLLYPLYESLCGQVVAGAEETLTAEPAGEVYARPLRIDPNAAVIVIERLARGYTGEPLEWRSSRGPADRFRYHVEIR